MMERHLVFLTEVQNVRQAALWRVKRVSNRCELGKVIARA